RLLQEITVVAVDLGCWCKQRCPVAGVEGLDSRFASPVEWMWKVLQPELEI
ncbi:hypothetical protein ILUMI_04545, partial [Ignelater luminosus]